MIKDHKLIPAQDICSEAIVWRQLKNKYIHPFRGIWVDSESLSVALVSPWMKNGDLTHYLLKNETADRIKIVSVFFSARAAASLIPLRSLK